MLSRNIVSRRSTLLARAIRAKSTQVQESGPIAADGRHEVSYEEMHDSEMKWVEKKSRTIKMGWNFWLEEESFVRAHT